MKFKLFVLLLCLMVVFFVASSNPNLYSVVSTPKLPSLSLSHKNVISHFNKTKYFTPSTNVQPKSTVGSSQSGDTTSTSNSPVQNSPVQTSDSINANPISYQAVSSSYLGSVLGYVSGISCPGSNVCYAVGYSSGQRLPMVIKSADGGVSWVQETLPVGVTQIDSISCINDLICDASGAGYLGFSGIIITTNDGGQTWSIAYQGGSRISQVNCSTISECIAAARVVEGTSTALMMSNYSFTTFVTENLSQLFWGTDLTCVLESSCYFLTQNASCFSQNECSVIGNLVPTQNSYNQIGLVSITTNAGASWTSIMVPKAISAILNISCTSNSNCLLTGIDNNNKPILFSVSAGSNGNWTPGNLYEAPSQIAAINGIYCYSANLCVGSGDNSNNIPEVFVTQNFGISWSIDQVSSTAPSFQEIDCNAEAVLSCLTVANSQDLSQSLIYQIALTSPTTSIYNSSLYTSTPVQLVNKNILVSGDSVALNIGLGMATLRSLYSLSVVDGAIIGCGITALPTKIYGGQIEANQSNCINWQQIYQNNINNDQQANVAILETGKWDSFTWIVNGQQIAFGDPTFDQYYENSLQAAIRILSSYGAHVIVVSSLYYSNATQPDGQPYRASSDSRISILNSLDQAVVSNSGGKASYVNLDSLICPSDTFQLVVNGITVRKNDGTHLTIQGAIYIANWLMSQIASITG